MNKIGFFFAFLLFSSVLFAQELDKCRDIVKLTTQAIESKDITELEQHLAPDFEISEISGKLALTVLKQLISQLNETVISSHEIISQKKESQLFLSYMIEYKAIGKKEAIFVFDEQNRLQKLELFKIEVLTKEKTDVKTSAQNIISIPFKLVGNLILVEVEVDGMKQDFILDSGSPSVVLNSKYYQKKDAIFKRKLTDSKGINGNVSDMSFVEIDHLDFYGIKINNQKLISIDLINLEKELNAKVYGLIGYEMIKDFDILYNYQAMQITLIKPEYFTKFRVQKLKSKALTVIPFELEKHIPIIKVKIKGKEYRMGIDSGAETNLLDDNLFKVVRKSLRKISTDHLLGIDGASKGVVKAQVKKLYIGHQKFKKSKFVFSDLSHLNNSYKIKLDGLIGYEILTKQKTLISYKRKEMVLIE